MSGVCILMFELHFRWGHIFVIVISMMSLFDNKLILVSNFVLLARALSLSFLSVIEEVSFDHMQLKSSVVVTLIVVNCLLIANRYRRTMCR